MATDPSLRPGHLLEADGKTDPKAFLKRQVDTEECRKAPVGMAVEMVPPRPPVDGEATLPVALATLEMVSAATNSRRALEYQP